MRAFYEPVALTAYEISDVERALAVLQHPMSAGDKTLTWCRAPAGIAPDVYLSHLRCVDLEDDDTDAAHALGENQHHGQSTNRHLQRIVLDAQGRHLGLPICLLGEEEDDHHAWRFDEPAQAHALQHLLSEAARAVLLPVQTQYALARRMVLLRGAWSSHHLLWKQRSMQQPVLAVATVRKRTIWWRPELPPATLEQAKTHSVPYSQAVVFDESAYQTLSFWQALWDYVQRCPLSEVQSMLSARYWNMDVRLHRTTHLPARGVGQTAAELLQQLHTGPSSVNTLFQRLASDPEDLLRTIVGLLFTRVITTEKSSSAEADSAYNSSQMGATRR